MDAPSDPFSFGCVLYEILTGKRPFEGENLASVIAAVLEREPAPLEISPPLDRVVERCLAKDPERRFQTSDLNTALDSAVERRKPEGDGGWLQARKKMRDLCEGRAIAPTRRWPPSSQWRGDGCQKE